MTDINPGQLVETINWKADRDLKNLDNTGTGFVIQPGTIIIWPGTTVPDGYLLCDGSAISRTTYAALFAVIGTTYGPGDSSGTFNLPNFQDRVIQGYGSRGSVGSYLNESLPNITGRVHNSANYAGFAFLNVNVEPDSALYFNTQSSTILPSETTSSRNRIGDMFLDASRSSSTYQSDAPVQPNALLIQCCIKY